MTVCASRAGRRAGSCGSGSVYILVQSGDECEVVGRDESLRQLGRVSPAPLKTNVVRGGARPPDLFSNASTASQTPQSRPPPWRPPRAGSPRSRARSYLARVVWTIGTGDSPRLPRQALSSTSVSRLPLGLSTGRYVIAGRAERADFKVAVSRGPGGFHFLDPDLVPQLLGIP